MMDFSESLSSLSPLLCVPLFVGSLCLALNYLVYSRRVAEWRKSKIPFLEPSFLIGHKYFWSVGSNSAVVPIDRIYRENKDKELVAFFIATMPVVLVRSPALIKQVSWLDSVTDGKLSISPYYSKVKTFENPIFIEEVASKSA